MLYLYLDVYIYLELKAEILKLYNKSFLNKNILTSAFTNLLIYLFLTFYSIYSGEIG